MLQAELYLTDGKRLVQVIKTDPDELICEDVASFALVTIPLEEVQLGWRVVTPS